MNEENLSRWHNLLALSAPTFAGDDTPPYGFATRIVARLHAEVYQQELVERIGLRAFFAALGLLLLTAGLTFTLDESNRGDLEPGLKSIAQVEDVQFS